MERAEILSAIDHTVLKPEAGLGDIEKAAAEAREHGFASVCANPTFVRDLARLLEGSEVKVCTVVGFPLGANQSKLKAFEAELAVLHGAREIDMVANIHHLMVSNEEALTDEIRLVVDSAKSENADVLVKVIVESAALMAGANADLAESRIACACRAVRAGGAEFIKTSTGFHAAGGASLEAVALMAKHGEGLRIKASGGIRDLEAAKAYLAAGASRLGTSAGVAIAAGLRGDTAY